MRAPSRLNQKNCANKTYTNWLIIGLLLLPLYGCDWFNPPEPMVMGCTESSAINFDVSANTDDGSCFYSTASFYAKFRAFAGIPITSIDVTINGSHEGTITSFYPNGPGNCSAPGTVQYVFKNSEAIDWNTTVYLTNGGTILNSGTLTPSRVQECLRVNVTR